MLAVWVSFVSGVLSFAQRASLHSDPSNSISVFARPFPFRPPHHPLSRLLAYLARDATFCASVDPASDDCAVCAACDGAPKDGRECGRPVSSCDQGGCHHGLR